VPPEVSAETALPQRYRSCGRVSDVSGRGISAHIGIVHVTDGAGVEVTESSVVVLPFAASSVGLARRRLVSDLVTAGVYGSAVGDAALVISELLSNALQHAKPLPGCNLRAAWELDDGSVQISVSDGGAQTRPELGQPNPSTTGGRGLRIVERLSRRWGARNDDEGTTVWAEVPVPRLSAVAVSAAATRGE
jgi:anti-sigma regulatory factor (Ser/Thr protein kinase)